MATVKYKTLLNQEPVYHKNTKLEWWGTLVGDAARERFMIAARTKEECLQAVRDFFPDAEASLIQPIYVRKRPPVSP